MGGGTSRYKFSARKLSHMSVVTGMSRTLSLRPPLAVMSMGGFTKYHSEKHRKKSSRTKTQNSQRSEAGRYRGCELISVSVDAQQEILRILACSRSCPTFLDYITCTSSIDCQVIRVDYKSDTIRHTCYFELYLCDQILSAQSGECRKPFDMCNVYHVQSHQSDNLLDRRRG